MFISTTKDELNIKNIAQYPIVEMFHSLQGEGYWSGVNAFFIRLAGCDVYCPWCDQKETWAMKKYPLISIDNLAQEVEKINTNHLIITGGEPLLHNLHFLTNEIRKTGKKIHLETSGSHPFSGNFDWVTFSPKPYKKPHFSIYDQVSELKVVISEKKDFIWAESEAEKLSKNILKFLQPEWNNPETQVLIFDYIKQNPHWRLSLQTHKFMEIR